MPAKRKLIAMAIDLLYIALFWVGFSSTSYSRTADLGLVAISLTCMLVLSAYRLRSWTSGRTDGHGLWRWLTDDYPESR